MKQFKIYTKGNYITIENNISSELYFGHKKEVFVDKNNKNRPSYRIFNVKDWKSNIGLEISEILKEDGTPYTEVEFDTFYQENTGNFKQGGVTPQILDALNNSNNPSASNPFITSDDQRVKTITTLDYNSLNSTITLTYIDQQGNTQTVDTTFGNVGIRYNVLNYNELLTISTQSLHDFAYIREAQGTQWLPGSLGGTYYSAGLYMWDGTSWKKDDTQLLEAVNTLVTNLHTHTNKTVLDLISQNDYNLVTSLSSSGLIYGGEVTINSLDNTKFDISSGFGVIVDNSVNPPTKNFINWSSKTAQITPFLSSATNTFLAVDINGDIVKTDVFQDLHDTPNIIVIGWIEHKSGTIIEKVGTEPYYLPDLQQQFQQFLEVLGAFNVEGNEVTANVTGLKVNKTAGIIFDNGINYSNDKKAVNTFPSNAITDIPIKYFYRDGLGGWNNTLSQTLFVNPNNYDDGSGILATVPNNHWTIQRCYFYAPFGYLDVYYDQKVYATKEDAINGLYTDTFIENEYFTFDVPLCAIVVEHGTTNLSNTSNCEIRKVGKNILGGVTTPSGEVNTISNIGTSGVGIYKQKVGVDLQLKKINASSNKITITDDTINSKIDINVNENNFTGIPQSSVTNLTSDLALKQNIFTSQAQNLIFASPNGSSGLPTFRSLVGTDVPILNQNTTGTANNITATSNNTLTTLSSLVLPQSQVSGLVTSLSAKEDNLNKQNSLATDVTNTKYPTVSAVNTGLATKEPTITSGTTSQYYRGDKSFQTLDKIAVGLANVENTALSTWNGSTNITTLGTIATGVWNGTIIADNKISTTLTSKTYNGLSLTANAIGFSLLGGTTAKTLNINNSLTLSGTDGSTLNVGTGGTLGSAAFTSSSNYEVPLAFSTGLTRSANTITVNTSQNIVTLSNLTTNGYVKTGGGIGTLSTTSTIPNTDISGLGTLATASSVNLSTQATGTLQASQMPSLAGEVTNTVGNLTTTVSNAAVIGKVLTGYTSGAGTVTATDNILQAIQKINGNDALKVVANTAITGATNTKITYDSKGLVTGSTSLVAGDIPNIAQSQVTNLTTDLANKQGTITLTTTGTSGASTLIGNTLNIPNYAGSGGATNLTYTPSATNGIVVSDTGTDATIPLGNGTNAGLSLNDFTTVEKTKLSGIATAATANSSDATLLNRSNHTGTQLASTISDFSTAAVAALPQALSTTSSPTFATVNASKFNVGTLGYTGTNILGSFQSSVNSYNQVVLQNTNSGTSATTSYILANNLTTTTANFSDIGLNSSTFNIGVSNSFNLPSATYISTRNGDLSIGTRTANAIHFVTNSSATDAMTISSTGVVTAPSFATSKSSYTDTSIPAAPVSGLEVFAKAISGKTQLQTKGATGINMPLQNSLSETNLTMWTPTTATGGVWLNTAGAGAGTYATLLPTDTNLYTSIKKGSWANIVTTTNQVIGQRNTESIFFRGSGVSGAGGFKMFARGGMTVWTNGGRFFCGMATATTVISANPSALANTVGFATDDTDAGVINFITRNATTTTKVSTGFTWASNQGYDFYIYCAPGSSQYTWEIRSLQTGASVTGTATATLPVDNTKLSTNFLASNAALTTATAVRVSLAKLTVETDY